MIRSINTKVLLNQYSVSRKRSNTWQRRLMNGGWVLAKIPPPKKRIPKQANKITKQKKYLPMKLSTFNKWTGFSDSQYTRVYYLNGENGAELVTCISEDSQLHEMHKLIYRGKREMHKLCTMIYYLSCNYYWLSSFLFTCSYHHSGAYTANLLSAVLSCQIAKFTKRFKLSRNSTLCFMSVLFP